MRHGPVVSVARGHRNYVHAIDLMRAAPLSPTDLAFQFRFLGLVQHPGQWLESGASGTGAAARATVRITGPDGMRHYAFVCADATAPLARGADFGFCFDPQQASITQRQLVTPLVAGMPFLEQMVEITRWGGQQMFPGQRWLTVGVSGNPACLQSVPSAATFVLRLKSQRARLNVMEFETSFGPAGQIMTTPA